MTIIPAPKVAQQWATRDLSLGKVFTHKLIDFDGLSIGYSRLAKRRYLRASSKRLKSVHRSVGNNKRDVCVVVGNGPSLNEVDWDCLEGADVFASNYAFLSEDIASRITYLCVTNPWVAAQAQDEFCAWGGTLIMPYYLSYWIPPDVAHILVDFEFGYQPATRLGEKVSTRSTVSYFALQLAICLGYKRIVMVGFDHNYEQPMNSVEGSILEGGASDPNHFSSEYFARKYWQAADLGRMNLVYALIAEVADRGGVRIWNCSTSSHLNIFERHVLERSTLAEMPAVDLTGTGNDPDTGGRRGVPEWRIAVARQLSALEDELVDDPCLWAILIVLLLPMMFGIASLSALWIAIGVGLSAGGIAGLWSALRRRRKRKLDAELWLNATARLNRP